jgi:hypothetical protein
MSSPKYQFTFTRQYHVISQKIELFITTDVRTSNHTLGVTVYHPGIGNFISPSTTKNAMPCHADDTHAPLQ